MLDSTTNNTVTNFAAGLGQPIERSTAELMMSLYQARINAVSDMCPTLGINAALEPKVLFFNIDNLNALIEAVKGSTKHIAVCLGLTAMDENGNPALPDQGQVLKLRELVSLQAEEDYNEYQTRIQNISLAQTVLIAGCDVRGNLVINEEGVYSFYDLAGHCCKS
ncbi:hypothetical protein [Adhaeribacter soli]|uniref:Uncharacterized protein n=1 Tax=Adhaeribacter soli TaxID=2607655 RepID=A0A5N1J4K9_9BACT|nr:hypothetical protein [Adhaeribacter soli]KAA9345647.1 hypothetical protein F0P94_00735 [Adhaeribacter soli]